jgi:hypothetical protein
MFLIYQNKGRHILHRYINLKVIKSTYYTKRYSDSLIRTCTRMCVDYKNIHLFYVLSKVNQTTLAWIITIITIIIYVYFLQIQHNSSYPRLHVLEGHVCHHDAMTSRNVNQEKCCNVDGNNYVPFSELNCLYYYYYYYYYIFQFIIQDILFMSHGQIITLIIVIPVILL